VSPSCHGEKRKELKGDRSGKSLLGAHTVDILKVEFLKASLANWKADGVGEEDGIQS
jgi:hypothetical protein